MPTTSRSALEFMRRHGFVETPKLQAPRLMPGLLRVNHVPLDRGQLDPAMMADAAGAPPSDRGIADQWPPPQEVRDHGDHE